MANQLKKAEYYFNRELSWLKFNERVLSEARSSRQPLLEKLKFISIFSSNLDEFFMIRVAGLVEQIHAGISDTPIDGLSSANQLEKIHTEVHKAVELQSRVLIEEILPELRKKGVRIRFYNSLKDDQKKALEDLFWGKIFPVLTPLAIDPAHPFPKLQSLGLNFLVELSPSFQRTQRQLAVVPIPQRLDRLIKIPSDNHHDFLMVEDLIEEYMPHLFKGMTINEATLFRVTRNADLNLAEAEADDLLQLIEKELRKRRLGTVIRLEVSDKMSTESRRFLRDMSGLRNEDIYDINGHLDLVPFISLLGLQLPKLKDKPFTPALSTLVTSSESIFDAIRKEDILLLHPYDSFNHVVELVHEASRDPKVTSIKQTLYRTSGQSPIVKALKDAVANNKEVTALIELKARFDEENNISWARELEQAGVHVIYGRLGLKTHCKTLMVAREEEDKTRLYLHLGTGNYNAKTAKLYTDYGLLTCDPDLGRDAAELFNFLTGNSAQKEWRKLLVAPSSLRKGLEEKLQEVIDNHSEEHPGRVMMVMNSLVDPPMIQHLYMASMKGVKVDLIIRGICCLRPGLEGISENIQVRSIVGRFLEHTRVFVFESVKGRKVYMGSADLMQRNLNRRVEVLFPVEKEALKEKAIENVLLMMKDNLQAWELGSDGEYRKIIPAEGEDLFSVQDHFLADARERVKLVDTIR